MVASLPSLKKFGQEPYENESIKLNVIPVETKLNILLNIYMQLRIAFLKGQICAVPARDWRHIFFSLNMMKLSGQIRLHSKPQTSRKE